MENLVITLDGTAVDLFGNETVAITYADFDLSDAATRNGAYTNTFKLPKTKRNLAIIRPYEKQACIIWARGIPLVNGYAAAATISDGIELNVIGQNADWFAEIAGKQLKDLNISELNHQRGFATLDPSTDGDIDWNDGYRYVPYNTGLCDTRFHEGYFTWELVHSYYARYIFEKIFSAIGWTVTGKGIEWPQFQTLMLTGSVPQASEEYLNLTSFRANASDPIGYDIAGVGGGDTSFDSLINSDIVGNQAGAFDNVSGRFTAVFDGFYSVMSQGQFARFIVSGGATLMNDVVYILKNEGLPSQEILFERETFSGGGVSTAYRSPFNIDLSDVWLSKGDTITLRVTITRAGGTNTDECYN